MTGVDPRVHPLAALDIPLIGGESVQIGFQSQQYLLRQAVCQMKGHMLRRLSIFKVRQISTAVPPGSALRRTPGRANLLIGRLAAANREIGVPGTVLRVAH